jgi:hypothetical protein
LFKIFQADKDTYITNKVINGVPKLESNVGQAGTLNLFKLYGSTYSGSNPNLELSRLLIHFNLDDLKNGYQSGEFDINNFSCQIKLFDVYGGQPCPSRFNVSVFPLSTTFDEGLGRDVVFYQDVNAANFLSSSVNVPWILSGAAASGSITDSCDYITGTIIGAQNVYLESNQFFVSGEEDLLVDVTQIISATLIDNIPDSGFRISFSETEENDQKSYFVKRFAARNAYDASKRPQLLLRYDDSVQDETQDIVPNTDRFLYLKNYDHTGIASNFFLNGNELSGSACLSLMLSSSYQTFYFSGSSVTKNGINLTGNYFSKINLANLTSSLKTALIKGPVKFKPYWMDTSHTNVFYAGDDFYVKNSNATTSVIQQNNLIVTTIPESSQTASTEKNTVFRVNIFDNSLRTNQLVKTSIKSKNLIFKNCYYRVVNAATKNIVVPFDDVIGSTRLSSDSNGMFFNLDPSVLIKNEEYYIDIMIAIDNQIKIFEKSSNTFKAA